MQRWRLLPPEHTHLLYDTFTRQMAPAFDLPEEQAASFPNLALASSLTWDVDQARAGSGCPPDMEC